MSDRLDSRIRAFVAELVDDLPQAPPFPLPEIVVISGDRSHRRRAMEASTTTRDQKPGWRGPQIAFGVIAAVAVAVVAVFALSNLIGSDEPSIPLSGSSSEEAVEAFAAVEAAYEVYNSGDAKKWAEVRDRGSSYPTERVQQESLEYEEAVTRAELAADGRIEISGCVSRGLGEWPGVADPGTPVAVGYYFTCNAVRTNALHAAAGLELASTYNWVVADGEIVAVSSEESANAWFDFPRQFELWLEDTHPTVWADMEFVRSAQFSDSFPAESSIPTALEYIDEYVASLP